MKVSELIKELEEVLNNTGDLEVLNCVENSEENTIIGTCLTTWNINHSNKIDNIKKEALLIYGSYVDSHIHKLLLNKTIIAAIQKNKKKRKERPIGSFLKNKNKKIKLKQIKNKKRKEA